MEEKKTGLGQVVEQVVETQGITVQKDATGMTQFRKLQVELNPQEDSRLSPLMVLRSEKNNRRFELHHLGKKVLTLEPDGAMRVTATSTDIYKALKDWVEKSVGL